MDAKFLKIVMLAAVADGEIQAEELDMLNQIKKAHPELKDIPVEYIHEPWLIPPLECLRLNFDISTDYCMPIVDLSSSTKHAKDTLWAMRKDELVRKEKYRILDKHVIPRKRKTKEA